MPSIDAADELLDERRELSCNRFVTRKASPDKPLAAAAGAYPTERALRLSKKSVHDTISGCCLSRALRWRSVMPPQIPNSTLLSSASAPHSCITGQ